MSYSMFETSQRSDHGIPLLLLLCTFSAGQNGATPLCCWCHAGVLCDEEAQHLQLVCVQVITALTTWQMNSSTKKIQPGHVEMALFA